MTLLADLIPDAKQLELSEARATLWQLHKLEAELVAAGMAGEARLIRRVLDQSKKQYAKRKKK